jgi:hydroxymethylbilane synthase
MWQAKHVKSLLEETHENLACELKTIKTTGDKITDVPLSRVGGKGLFTKEIEEALLRGEIDLAVHSMKDLPTALPDGLTIGAVLERAHSGDAFVSKKYDSLSALPEGAEVGTSSLRRRAQLLAYRPGLNVVDLRGNLDTRLRKVAEENPPAAIIAVAGIRRLGRENEITEIIDTEIMLPAVAQGAIAIEIRENDDATGEILAPLHCEETAVCCEAERAFLRELEGGCQVPIGARAVARDGKLLLEGVIASLDGKQIVRDSFSGPASDAKSIGTALAMRARKAGGDEILASVRRQLKKDEG